MDFLKTFFEKEKIEYYSVLSYSDCRETSPHIMRREAFEPKSIIIFLIPYYGGETVNLSRYAAARDYHIYIKGITERLIFEMKKEYPSAMAKGYGDHSPIDERHAALISGLGISGDNGLLINEKYGSYIFIADVITDISPELLNAKTPISITGCEHCGACKRACPTGILAGDYADCLSAITQKKGALSDSEVWLMQKYNSAWGCDICQTSCPKNRNPITTPISFFLEKRINELTAERLSEMNEVEFSERAFAWRGRVVVERNLEILNVK